MIIASATDNQFAELAAVMLSSLAAKGELGAVDVWLFCDCVSARHKRMIAQSIAATPLRLKLVDIDRPTRQRFEGLRKRKFVSNAAYIRLLIPEIISSAGGGGDVSCTWMRTLS